MDWFQRITGFAEADPDSTRARLRMEGRMLVSLANGSRHDIGHFEMPTLGQLRQRSAGLASPGRRTTVRCLSGDARALHADPAFAGALFQVASQFNLLEMPFPQVTPEQGVTGYQHDHTQGPACAMAVGAATIWRNHLVPMAGGLGQTATRQLDGLAGMGAALSARLGLPVAALWQMRNGYALGTPQGLAAIGQLLGTLSEDERQALRDTLAIGLHVQADVTDQPPGARQRVSQAFCSAVPVSYSRLDPALWQPLARLVLEAAYEATLRAACEAAARGDSPIVLLTSLGGGAFGNDERWIDDAIDRALRLVAEAGLDVRLVSFGATRPGLASIERRWRGG